MREECKHFQSRTYDNGEVARFCVLGNAPDQPFSCPSDCITFEKRFADVGWSRGTLVSRPSVEAPGDSSDREAVLAAAADIVGAVAPELFEARRREVEERERKKRNGWKFWRR